MAKNLADLKSTSDTPDNPAAVVGHNRPPIPTPVEIRNTLNDQTVSRRERIKELAEKAKAKSKQITTDDELRDAADAYKALDAARKEWESLRVGEKEPFLEGQRAVDGFFMPIRDRVGEVLAELSRVTTSYLQEKEARERAKREAEARRQREEADRRQREADELRRKEQEARDRAEIAKRNDSRAKAEADAEARRVQAASAQAAADAASAQADAADRQVEAKPAEFARTRGEGSLATLGEVFGFEIVDVDAIPLADLRPYIKREHIEQAIRKYVVVNKDQRPLAGVRFFSGRKAQIR